MARTVKVNLDVEEQPYVAGIGRAERATERLDDAVDDLGASAKATTAGMGKAQDTIGDTGDKARTTAREFDKLSDEIRETEARVKSLADQIRRTGPDADLLNKFGAEEAKLAKLARVRRALGEIGEEVVKVGAKSAKFTLSGLTDAVGSLPSQLKGAAIVGLTGAAAAAAPAIGAIVGGAVLAGVGSAGIGAGVALAFQDPRVSNAASDLGMRVKNAFVDAADGMVGPTIEALGVLGDAAVDVAGQMGGVFDALAPEVVPLAEAIGDMARNAMPGFREAIEAARPALRAMGQALPEIGDALSDMFSTISNEGDGAILGLLALFDLAEGAIRATGATIAWLSARFEEFVRVVAKISGEAEDLWGWIPGVGDRIRSANDHTEEWLKQLEASKGPAGTARSAFGEVGDAAEEAGEEAEEAAKRYEELFGLWMDVDTSAIAVQQAIDDLTESFRDNLATLDINTEAGRENASQLLDAVEAAKAHEEAMIRDGKSAAYANQVFLATVQGLYNQARAAGASTAELDALLGKYLRLAAAENIVKTITYRQVFTQHGQVFQPQGGGHQFFAKGGIVAAQEGMIATSPTVLFGERETGVEAFIPQRGISRGRGMALGAEAMRWHQASVVPWEQMAGLVSAAASGRGGQLDEVALGRALRSALRGMSVQLDGHTVGRIEARRADLYARGG